MTTTTALVIIGYAASVASGAVSAVVAGRLPGASGHISGSYFGYDETNPITSGAVTKEVHGPRSRTQGSPISLATT